MRVAFVNQPFDGVLPPHQNSIGIWTYQIAHRLSNSFDVTVYAKRMAIQPDAMRVERGVCYRFMRTVPVRIWNKYSHLFSRYYEPKKPLSMSHLYFFDYALAVALHARKEKYDVIHVQNFPQFVPVLRALNPDSRIVLHMNCEWVSQMSREVIEPRIKKADLLLGSSQYITDKIQERYPQLGIPCQVAYNGLDEQVFSVKECQDMQTESEEIRLLFVGRISPEKGIHILLDAFCKISERCPQARLIIVGPAGVAPYEYIVGPSDDPNVTSLASFYEGDYITQLQAKIPPHLADRVVFTGPMAHTDVVKQYQQAHLLINPSLSESFGMSLVEAMACGVPVVATAVGGMVEIVQKTQGGVLAPPNDVDALAETILDLISDREKRTALANSGRQSAPTLFSWDVVAEDLMGQYDKLQN